MVFLPSVLKASKFVFAALSFQVFGLDIAPVTRKIENIASAFILLFIYHLEFYEIGTTYKNSYHKVFGKEISQQKNEKSYLPAENLYL